MIINLSISTERILRECITQTSLDIQAMRAQGVETADIVYDDWIMNEANAPELYSPIQDACADLYHVLRTLIAKYSAGRDIISIDIMSYNYRDGKCRVLENMLLQYLKNKILWWWYRYRNTALSQLNLSLANEALDNMFHECIKSKGRTIGRYF